MVQNNKIIIIKITLVMKDFQSRFIMGELLSNKLYKFPAACRLATLHYIGSSTDIQSNRL